mmetsp:Transcript_34299/g.78249  ORF Transcript_34299/g.78249 Transcript_34299/m.78249 type:complete len:238 (+) Transcript_34299:55-768(+)
MIYNSSSSPSGASSCRKVSMSSSKASKSSASWSCSLAASLTDFMKAASRLSSFFSADLTSALTSALLSTLLDEVCVVVVCVVRVVVVVLAAPELTDLMKDFSFSSSFLSAALISDFTSALLSTLAAEAADLEEASDLASTLGLASAAAGWLAACRHWESSLRRPERTSRAQARTWPRKLQRHSLRAVKACSDLHSWRAAAAILSHLAVCARQAQRAWASFSSAALSRPLRMYSERAA